MNNVNLGSVPTEDLIKELAYRADHGENIKDAVMPLIECPDLFVRCHNCKKDDVKCSQDDLDNGYVICPDCGTKLYILY